MLKRSFKVIFAVMFVFVVSSAALALPPQDAISARSAESLYAVLSIGDLSGLLNEIFSDENIGMVKPLLNQEQVQSVMFAAGFAKQISVKSVLIAAGITSDTDPFVQAAITIPESDYDKLGKVHDGSATGADIAALIFGENGMTFAEEFGFIPEVHKDPNGVFYTFQILAFAARDNLLLITSSMNELDNSLEALHNKDKRLSFKSRFDSPNFLYLHMDANMTAALAKQLVGTTLDVDAIDKLYKAPLEIELALSSKPGSVLFSAAANIMDSLADSARFKNLKPVRGANIFMAGAGKILLAFAAPFTFNAADLKANPEFADSWSNFVNQLKMINITEDDIEDLLNSSVSIAFGCDASIMGASVPGGYIALSGRDGAAARIYGKIMNDKELMKSAPLLALKAEGWDSAYTADPAALPASLVSGVKKDTLFIGLINPDTLTNTPEVPPSVAVMLEKPLVSAGFIDVAEIWAKLRQETANPDSYLSKTLEEPFKSILNVILTADPSVPLVKIWLPELETVFMEFSVVDVPEEKRLLPILIKLSQTPDAINPASTLTEYDFGDDKVPSVNAVIGKERKVIGMDAGISAGSGQYKQYSYETASMLDDLISYSQHLRNNGWLVIKDYDLNTGAGEMQLAAESAEKGKILIMTVNFEQNKYTINITKMEGTLTRK